MIELPKDAEGREIPLDTKVLYNEDGKCFEVNRFTYSVVQTMPGLKRGVVFMDCRYDYCSSFYLTPPETPDSWKRLLDDLDNAASKTHCGTCSYFGMNSTNCDKCTIGDLSSCDSAAMRDIASRIRKLMSED